MSLFRRALTVLFLLTVSPLFAQNIGTPWSGIDALERSVDTASVVGTPKPNRVTAIFYFLWHDVTLPKVAYHDGPPDVSQILKLDPDAVKKPNMELWTNQVGLSHYWSEPLYGYYKADDPWVLRRHAFLLADAGIDFLIFDTTNAVTYPKAYRALCKVFSELRAQGEKTPQIAFMVNTKAGETARKVFEDLYKPGDYRELWFQWDGKPLMICDPAAADDELKSFFTLRKAHWPFQMVDTPFAWHWEATYPQPYGYTTDPKKPEMVNVSVAQNLARKDGTVTNMSSGNARGRSFHDKLTEYPYETEKGHNFAEQWKRAYELDPPVVFVTGWNEWIAGRWQRPGQPVVFVDQFDAEHSRDIEPVKGGHGDNYYMQLVEGVRKYKGTPPLPKVSVPKTIDPDGPMSQWGDVGPELRDHHGETIPREFLDQIGRLIRNMSGRNDFSLSKIARDGKNVYFYVKTVEKIQPAPVPQGLWLLLDTDRELKTGWIGGDILIGRQTDARTMSVERNVGNAWDWKPIGNVNYRLAENELCLSVPIALLGLQPQGDPLDSLDFKWIDNARTPGDPLDLYLSGDTAPDGRFFYRVAP